MSISILLFVVGLDPPQQTPHPGKTVQKIFLADHFVDKRDGRRCQHVDSGYNAEMSRGEEKTKWWKIWRLRFSVRTLTIFVTLVCAYFGAWEATKRYGVPQKTPFAAQRHLDQVPQIQLLTTINEAWSPAPFIIACDEQVMMSGMTMSGKFLFHKETRYYLWFFSRIRLPIPYVEKNWDGR